MWVVGLLEGEDAFFGGGGLDGDIVASNMT